jgi:hypothetical protein
VRIEIHVKNEKVSRNYWPPHEINFTELRSDIDDALDKAERALRHGDFSEIAVKVEHTGDEFGMIKVILEE